MAVTKTVSIDKINYAIDNCGIDLIGENKVQEFLSKKDELHLDGVEKHLIGHLQTNKVKYYSDFKEFVFESSVEDFCDTSDADVVVSTIHKAKGREFDDVYMLLSDNFSIDDNLMRRYYVGITRAKNRLFIHTNSALFDRMKVDQHIVDTKEYATPEEIVLQLSHKDVNLGFFKNLKREILSLRAGDSLIYDKFILFHERKPIAKLSQNMQQKMLEWHERGYMVKSASVRFVVAWKPKDAPKEEPEYAVLLADMVLSSKGIVQT